MKKWMLPVMGLMLCGAICAAAVVALYGPILPWERALEPETNRDGFEFGEIELFYNQGTYMNVEENALLSLAIRLTEARPGAAERGYACYGFFDLVLRDVTGREIAALPLNPSFDNQPIGFETAAFPQFGKTSAEYGTYLLRCDFTPGWILAIGQPGFGAPEGYRAYTAFLIDKEGALSALPVEDDFLVAPENLVREDFVRDRIRDKTPAPNGDFMNFSGTFTGSLIQTGRWRTIQEFVPETDYWWNGESYQKRRSDYNLRPVIGYGDLQLDVTSFSSPFSQDVPNKYLSQVIYAGTPQVDYFYTVRDSFRDEGVSYRAGVYLVKDGKQTLIAGYEDHGWPRINNALFDGRYFYWQPTVDLEGIDMGPVQRYDSLTGLVEDYLEPSPFRVDGDYVVPNEGPASTEEAGWTYVERETGRQVRVYYQRGEWRSEYFQSPHWKGLLPIVYHTAGFSEQKLVLLDLASGAFAAGYPFRPPMPIRLHGASISGKYAVLSGRMGEVRNVYCLLDLQSGECQVLWDSPDFTARDIVFITEDCFAFVHEETQGILFYRISTQECFSSQEFTGRIWNSLARAYDGKTLLAYTDNGECVTAFTPAETAE